MSSVSSALLAAALELRSGTEELRFRRPVACVYNPLVYAWDGYAEYVRRYALTRKRVVFLGMNPGPFGMVQTGVPFGEVSSVRRWLQIEAEITRPPKEHPRRPVEGFECKRSEVSGLRLWGLFAGRFGSAPDFFSDHLVLNYCPLAFVEETGRNRTPNKLPPAERERLFRLCDRHLFKVISVLKPEWLIGIGEFAAQRAVGVAEVFPALRLGKILHPSPASPVANRGWAEAATLQLRQLGVWPVRDS